MFESYEYEGRQKKNNKKDKKYDKKKREKGIRGASVDFRREIEKIREEDDYDEIEYYVK